MTELVNRLSSIQSLELRSFLAKYFAKYVGPCFFVIGQRFNIRPPDRVFG